MPPRTCRRAVTRGRGVPIIPTDPHTDRILENQEPREAEVNPEGADTLEAEALREAEALHEEEENVEEREKEEEPEREKVKTTRGSSNNTEGCSYKTFMGRKPKELNGNEGTIQVLRWIDEMEAILDISNYAEKDKVRSVTHSLNSKALEWWNTIVKIRARQQANGMSWAEFTDLLTRNIAPPTKWRNYRSNFYPCR